MKRCANTNCRETSPEFYKDKTKKDGLSSWCKACSKQKNVDYHVQNRDRILERQKRYSKTYVRKPENDRRAYLKKRYNITPAEYQALFEKQKGRCAICRKKKPLRVDHNHESGRVRKLLCHHCNIGLGEFFDKPSLLQRAIRYLEEHA